MNKLKADIICYDDFLTKEECNSIIQVLEYKVSKNEFNWNPISFYESYSSGYPHENDPDLAKFNLPGNFFVELEKKVKSTTEDLIGGEAHKISFHTQKWIPGAFAGFHSDNSYDGKPSAFERSRYAGFIYLNDDFEGGLLNFRDDPISIKPKPGRFVIFAGGGHNMHEVTVVKKGNRYTIGSFWDDRPEEAYSQETREAWAEEIAETRARQKVEQAEWEEIRLSGNRISPTGQQYSAKFAEDGTINV